MRTKSSIISTMIPGGLPVESNLSSGLGFRGWLSAAPSAEEGGLYEPLTDAAVPGLPEGWTGCNLSDEHAEACDLI